MARRFGGGVLPNLLPPEAQDAALARRKEYLHELQQQAEVERQRKLKDRGVGQFVPGLAQAQVFSGVAYPRVLFFWMVCCCIIFHELMLNHSHIHTHAHIQQGVGALGGGAPEGRRKDGPQQNRAGGGPDREDILKQLRLGFQNAMGDVISSVGQQDGKPDGPQSARISQSHEVDCLLPESLIV
jgi:hypothetical protein